MGSGSITIDGKDGEDEEDDHEDADDVDDVGEAFMTSRLFGFAT